MKKKYISPETYERDMELQQMIASSIDLDPEIEIEDPNDVGANKNGSFWDDED